MEKNGVNEIGNLNVKRALVNLVNGEILPGTGIDQQEFWLALENLVRDLEPENHRLLKKRDALQQQVDRLVSPTA